MKSVGQDLYPRVLPSPTVILSITVHSEVSRSSAASILRVDTDATFRGPIHLQIHTVNGFTSSFVTWGTCRFYNEGSRRCKVHSREDECEESGVATLNATIKHLEDKTAKNIRMENV